MNRKPKASRTDNDIWQDVYPVLVPSTMEELS
jgi:hypothetical protein